MPDDNHTTTDFLWNRLHALEHRQSQMQKALTELKQQVAALRAEGNSDILRPNWRDLERMQRAIDELWEQVGRPQS